MPQAAVTDAVRTALRVAPFEATSLMVWADTLLEVGDVRGECIRAAQSGDAQALRVALDEARPSRAAAFGERTLVLRDGVLETVVCPEGDVPDPAECLSEPLLTLEAAFETRIASAEAMQRVLECAHHGQAYGLALRGLVSDDAFELLLVALRMNQPLLSLTLASTVLSPARFERLTQVPNQTLRELRIDGLDVANLTSTRELLRNVERLSLRFCATVSVAEVLALPALRHIDVWGVTLTHAERQALDHWPHAVVHQDFPRVDTPSRRVNVSPRRPVSHSVKTVSLVDGENERAEIHPRKCVWVKRGHTFYFEVEQVRFHRKHDIVTLLTREGELRSFSVETGQSVGGWSPPERIVDVHPFGKQAIAWTEDSAWMVDLSARSAVLLTQHSGQRRLNVSAHEGLIAAWLSPSTIRILSVAAGASHALTLPQTFDLPADKPLFIDDVQTNKSGIIDVTLSTGSVLHVDGMIPSRIASRGGDFVHQFSLLVDERLHQVRIDARGNGERVR
jgi:hypothetical protein